MGRPKRPNLTKQGQGQKNRRKILTMICKMDNLQTICMLGLYNSVEVNHWMAREESPSAY
jgi:hypothetical protein